MDYVKVNVQLVIMKEMTWINVVLVKRHAINVIGPMLGIVQNVLEIDI